MTLCLLVVQSVNFRYTSLLKKKGDKNVFSINFYFSLLHLLNTTTTHPQQQQPSQFSFFSMWYLYLIFVKDNDKSDKYSKLKKINESLPKINISSAHLILHIISIDKITYVLCCWVLLKSILCIIVSNNL